MTTNNESSNESEVDFDDYLDDDDETTMNNGFLKTLLRISSNDKSLTSLDLSIYEELDINRWKFLSIALRTNTNISSIDIEGSEINDDCAMSLSTALPHTAVKKLFLWECRIGNQGIEAIGKACQNKTCTLEDLDLSNSGLDDSKITSFANGIVPAVVPLALPTTLTVVTRLKKLHLCYNSFGTEGIKAIGSILNPKICALETLNLSHNRLGDDGAVCLGESIVAQGSNILLRQLSLNENNISDKGAVALFQHLQACTALETLHLDDNEISDNGVVSFVKSIARMKALAELSLAENNFADKGVISILESFQKGRNIQNDTRIEVLDLRCRAHRISDDGAKRIAPLVSQLNTNTLHLGICVETLHGKGLILNEGLRYNYSLKGVYYEDWSEDTNLVIQMKFYLKLNRAGRRIMEIDKNNKAYSYLWTSLLSKKSINNEEPSPSMMYYFLRENPDLFENIHKGKKNLLQQSNFDYLSSKGTKRKRKHN